MKVISQTITQTVLQLYSDFFASLGIFRVEYSLKKIRTEETERHSIHK